jgi:hypothetical protein
LKAQNIFFGQLMILTINRVLKLLFKRDSSGCSSRRKRISTEILKLLFQVKL